MSQPYGPPASQWPPPAAPQPWYPVARPPKPEVPLRPTVWWSVVINAIYALGTVLLIVVFGALLVAIFSGASAGEWDLDLGEDETALVVAVLVGIFVVTLLVGLALTVGALLLLRLGSGFRTFPAFVQALLASLCAFVAGNILSGVVGVIAELASFDPAVFGQ